MLKPGCPHFCSPSVAAACCPPSRTKCVALLSASRANDFLVRVFRFLLSVVTRALLRFCSILQRALCFHLFCWMNCGLSWLNTRTPPHQPQLIRVDFGSVMDDLTWPKCILAPGFAWARVASHTPSQQDSAPHNARRIKSGRMKLVAGA